MTAPCCTYYADRAAAACQWAVLQRDGRAGIVGTHIAAAYGVAARDVWLVHRPGQPAALALSEAEARATLGAVGEGR